MNYPVLISETFVAIAFGMGIALLILELLPPNHPQCTRIENYVQVGTITHEDLKLHFTPLTKDLSNIILIDDIYKLRENFLYRTKFKFETLCSLMPFFFNLKTEQIVPVKQFDKIFTHEKKD